MATFSPKFVLDNQRHSPRSLIVRYILREHQGICLFEDLIGKETISFKNKEEIKEYIKSEEGKGTLGMQHAPQGDIVFVNFGEDAELCKTYKKKSSFCQKTCQNFHLCDFGLMGKCYYKDTCQFYHNLQNEHNRNLVTKLNLDDMADDDILSYLKLKRFIQRKISRNSDVKIGNGSKHLATRCTPDKTALVNTNPSLSLVHKQENKSSNSTEERNGVLEQHLTAKMFANENDKTSKKVTNGDSSSVALSQQVKEQQDNMTKERSGDVSDRNDKRQTNISKEEENDVEPVYGDQIDLLHTGSSESMKTAKKIKTCPEYLGPLISGSYVRDSEESHTVGIQERNFGTSNGTLSRDVGKDVLGPKNKYFNPHTLKGRNWEQWNQNTKNELILRYNQIPTIPICNKFITNSCQDPHCNLHHCSMPYLWCIAENNEWKAFDRRANVEIERSYSHPDNKSTIVRNSNTMMPPTYCNANISRNGLKMKTFRQLAT